MVCCALPPAPASPLTLAGNDGNTSALTSDAQLITCVDLCLCRVPSGAPPHPPFPWGDRCGMGQGCMCAGGLGLVKRGTNFVWAPSGTQTFNYNTLKAAGVTVPVESLHLESVFS
jgi:hypothetical protein